MANAMNENRGEADKTLTFTKQPYVVDVGPRRIKDVKFSMFSGEDVLKLGEVQVSRSQYYVSQEDKRPVDNGVLDAHMACEKMSCCPRTLPPELYRLFSSLHLLIYMGSLN
ncbi:unnamed protein product [Lactuca virosa]|uniref:DNA-directed RNA polymerase n=1 Tax=Lactuca virosa TaxID=75947 RepID=A0AAU9N7Y6_9ASTR|nr:unnamed protein product [Lactuca virosa]